MVSDWVLLGKLNILLGLCRFYLLLPTSLLDPAMKYIVKKDFVASLLRDTTTELQVRQQVEEFTTGGRSNVIVDLLEKNAKYLKQHENRLKEKVSEYIMEVTL